MQNEDSHEATPLAPPRGWGCKYNLRYNAHAKRGFESRFPLKMRKTASGCLFSFCTCTNYDSHEATPLSPPRGGGVNIIREDRRRMREGLPPLPPEQGANYVGDMPDEFKAWCRLNAGRVKRAKSVPNFIRDNQEYYNASFQNKTLTPLELAEQRHAQRTLQLLNALTMAVFCMLSLKRTTLQEVCCEILWSYAMMAQHQQSSHEVLCV